MENNYLVLVRHGESIWNKLEKFTGWTNVELSDQGKTEAKQAGKILKRNKFKFDISYTSVLNRAIDTLWKILKELNQCWIPVKKTWYLNERHYGKLQGLSKIETNLKYGEKTVEKWRRSFTSIPPKLNTTENLVFINDEKYKKLNCHHIPVSESLELTLKRILPYWKNIIFPNIKKKKNVLIVAHGNSLRALVKYLSRIKNHEIPYLSIPTGIPIIYSFDKNLYPLKYYFLEK
ncbi:2,3-diphosphoglycerate-dependent phosphoglycerate mutase [Buchnera aphidicola]|uniref:2,3-bisphosphoglycerate-dependent phosphoglycerate mutase n=1 Tax=Buchnera aphidicola (Stegophylla sp.) TaxID=2315800 RepID=A0A4D6YAA7_9GAMM|nr:2,3-diphosphoglycerate-dependent phosphoglycerate mutase [Buchnera aphidicola (Stegophylla sp.)]QCI26369.1 2,3-diphosphoglycerate-dependent phosphoglycerate mutase [Buchnera aphidicola (Stegophylla sp.)]